MTDEAKAFIKYFLEDKNQKSIELTVEPLSVIEEVLEANGYWKKDDDESTNGWQVDFFYHYIRGVDTILLHGSLWYGNFKLTRE